MKKILLYLILIMAVGMAAIVAYVSVGGLLKVFSGAGTLGLIFFSSIEILKIVATSAIHTYGKKISWIYKSLLSIGIGIAMVITSIGIYGFLSSTYQETFMKLENVEAQVSLLEKKRDGFQIQLDNVMNEKISIDGRISELSKGLSNNVIQYKDKESGQIITTTSSSTRRALEKQLNGAMTRQDALNIKSDGLNDKVYELDNQIVEVKLGNDSAAELGPLKYLSEVTGKSMDEVMKYFIFLLIIIGDPMAVLMVIIFNKIVKKDDEDKVVKKNKPEKKTKNKLKNKIKTIGSLFKRFKNSNKTTPTVHNQVKPQVIEEVIPVIETEPHNGDGLKSYMDVIEKPKEELKESIEDNNKSNKETKITVEDIKEKREERKRGFSVSVPDRNKSDTVSRVGSNKETRNGNKEAMFFKRRP